MLDNKIRLLFSMAISAILWQQAYLMNATNLNLKGLILMISITGLGVWILIKEY